MFPFACFVLFLLSTHIQKKYFFHFRFNSSGHSHVCSGFTNEETEKLMTALPTKRQKSSWQFWSFCHIHKPCSWCHWCRLLGTKCQHSQLCFNVFVLVACIDSETILPRNIPTGWRWQWKRDAAATESRGCSFAGTVTETGRCHSCIVCCTGGTVALQWLYHCCRRWIACCTGSAVILCWLYWVYSCSMLTVVVSLLPHVFYQFSCCLMLIVLSLQLLHADCSCFPVATCVLPVQLLSHADCIGFTVAPCWL